VICLGAAHGPGNPGHIPRGAERLPYPLAQPEGGAPIRRSRTRLCLAHHGEHDQRRECRLSGFHPAGRCFAGEPRVHLAPTPQGRLGVATRGSRGL